MTETLTTPLVSIVVPVLNEEGSIEHVLAALSRQTEERFEAIFADGGSTDATTKILAAAAVTDPRITLVANPRRLQSAGLNSCLEVVRAERMIRLDGHCHIPDDYIERVLELFDQSEAAVVGGQMRAEIMETNGTDTETAKAIALANGARWGAGPARFHRDGSAGEADTVYLGAFRTSVVRSLGGWAEDVGVNEDYELNFRIRQAGHRVWLDPSLSVGYEPRSSYRRLAIQYFRYGRSKAATLRRHPSSLRLRQLLPALGPAAVVVAAGVTAAASGAVLPAVVAGATIVAGSGAVVTFAALLDGMGPVGRRMRAALAAFIMHWTWAGGFWFGLVRRFPAAGSR